MKKLLLLLLLTVLAFSCRTVKTSDSTKTDVKKNSVSQVETKTDTNVSVKDEVLSKEESSANKKEDVKETTSSEKSNVTEKFDDKGTLKERSTTTELTNTTKLYIIEINSLKSTVINQKVTIDSLISESFKIKSELRELDKSKSLVTEEKISKSNWYWWLIVGAVIMFLIIYIGKRNTYTDILFSFI